MFNVLFTEEEIRDAFTFSEKRNAANARRGWKKRHQGREPLTASVIGDLGETAFARFLASEAIPFRQAARLVDRRSLIEQDFTVGRIKIGVSTTSHHPSRIERWTSVFYPVKDGSKILGYPDVLVLATVVLLTREATLIGAVGRRVIVDSPVSEDFDHPTHEIPREKFRDLESLVRYLKENGGTRDEEANV